MFFVSYSIAIIWIFLILYWFISAIKSKRNYQGYNWRLELLVRAAIVFFVILFLRIPGLHHIALLLNKQAFYSNLYVMLFGFIIFLLGIYLTVLARISLGKNWGMPMTIKDKPDLVTSGPYHFIRHPIYSGMILAMLGTALSVNVFWIIPLLIVSVYFVFSAIVEENNMLRLFPKEYEKYKSKTKAFIPLIY